MKDMLMRTLLALLLIAGAAAADRTWDAGSGANENWSTDQNWGNLSNPDGTTDSATLPLLAAPADRLPVVNDPIDLNRLTITSSGGYTIDDDGVADSVLTMAGTSPIIEVLAGSHTISAEFALAADLTIYVAAGAVLTISDTDIAGAYRITKIGTGTLNLDVGESGPASAPSFTAPDAVDKPTGDATPTWTWTSNAGAGFYRYRLDSGGWSDTTATSFTPPALSNGVHTLDVQEYNRLGQPSVSATASWSIDNTPPQIVSRTTADDGNGRIDGVYVVFSEIMDTAELGSWTVGTYTVGTPVWQPDDKTLLLPLTEQSSYDTAALPVVQYTAGSVADAGGNALAIEASGTAAVDGASPVVVDAKAVYGSNNLTLSFSEPVVTTGAGAGNLVDSDLDFVPTRTVNAFSDANGLDQVVSLSLTANIASGDEAGVAAGEVYDLAGNAAAADTIAITEPVTARETKQAGPWTDANTWVGLIVPGAGDDVVLRHAVTYATNDFRTIRSLTFEAGGGLSAVDVPNNGSYTILELLDRKVTANANATVANVQFYDSFVDVDTIITVAPSVTLVLNNGVQGHFLRRVVKRGTGTLTWNSPFNGLSVGQYDDGPTRIEAGIFQLLVTNGRPATYEWAVLGGTTLDLRVDQSIALLTGQGTVTNNGSALRTLTLSGSAWSGALQNGANALAVQTSGINSWSGINTFTGGLTLNSGSLTIAGTRAIADTCAVALAAGSTLTVDSTESVGRLSGAGNVVLNAALSLNHGGSADTLSGTISGTGLLTVSGSGGSLTLAGTNSHSGGTQVNTGGTVQIASNTGLGAPSGALTFAGGTLRLTGTVNMTSAALADNVDGSGPTGLFPLATQGAPAADRPIAVTAADGAIDMGAYSLALPAFDTLAGQDLSVRGTAATTNYSGSDSALFLTVPAATTRSMAGKVLSGGGRFGFLVKRGTGTLAFTSTGNTFDKNIVRVEEGALDFGASGSLGSVSANGWVYILSGATGSINNIAYASAPILYLSGTLSVGGTSSWDGQVDLWSGNPVIAVGAAAQLTLPQVVVNSTAASLDKTGTGRLVLGNAGNTFALPITVSAGTLEAGADGCLGDAANALTLAGGRLYAPSGFATGRTLNLGAGGGILDVAEGQTLTWNGGIYGATALSKDGKGGLVLGNAGNTFTGGIVVAAGSVSFAADGALGGLAPASGVTLSGGTLASTATVVINASRAIALGTGGGIIDVASATSLSYAGALTGATGLGKTGDGTLVLGGNNAGFTGQIGISAGLLRATSANALGSATPNTVVQSGAGIEFSGGITVAEQLSVAGIGPGGAGALLASSGTPVLSGNLTLVQTANPTLVSVTGTSLTLNGVISGAGGLNKTGAGTLVLGNANTFTGNLSVLAGTLAIAADGNLGAGANQLLIDGGGLSVTATTATTRIVRVGASDGTISVAAGQTFTLSGFDTAAGQDLAVAGTGELRIGSAAGTSTIAGLISGSGPLRKVGASQLVLTGASVAYSGTATVANGTMVVAGQLASSLFVANGGTLAGTGQVGALTVQSGGMISPAGASAAGVLGAASLVLDPGAVLDWDLGSANDQLVVSGTATIAAPITTARHLDIRAYPAPAAFGIGDYPLISAGTLSYSDGAVVMRTVPATATANYRVTVDGSTLVLQRNRAPTVATGVADELGTGSTDTSTTPPSYDIGPPGSTANFNDDVAGSATIPLVQASDPEGAPDTDLTFTLRLDPGVGVIERDAGGGSWQVVSADGALKTFTQADVAAGIVRYRSTGLIGGNDAILYDVSDANGAVSPLYLMRFTIQGNGPPVIGATPASLDWVEEAVKPGAWTAIAPVATVQDADTPNLDGGLLQVTVINAESGDELAFIDGGVTIIGDVVQVNDVAIGTVVVSADSTDLSVTLNAAASEARVTALLRSASFRTANPAPQAVLRSIRIQAEDGSLGGGVSIVAYPLNIDLYNDAPSLQLRLDLNGVPTDAAAVAAVPGLTRLGRVVPNDPEGVLNSPPGNIDMQVTQSPLRGSIDWFNADGTFSYTPYFIPPGFTGDVQEDSFTVTVTDLDFDGTARRVVGAGDPARYLKASRQVVVPVRIAAAANGLAFRNPPRMTVDPLTAGSFSYQPDMRLPAGSGTLVFELVDVPVGVPLGSGGGEINFNPVNGAIDWPAVPDPTAPPYSLPAPYWRFGLLATDPATGSAALLPVMLRVGPGGING